MAPSGSAGGSFQVRRTLPPLSPGLSTALKSAGAGSGGGGGGEVCGAEAAADVAARRSVRRRRLDAVARTGAEPRARPRRVSTGFSSAKPHDRPDIHGQDRPAAAEEAEGVLHGLAGVDFDRAGEEGREELRLETGVAELPHQPEGIQLPL